VVFSPAGTAAALYDSGAGRVQVLTGLPDAAAVRSDVDISALAGPVAALAVDDAGSSLFLAAGAAEAVSLYRVALDGTSQFLASFRSVAALRLSANGREALLADSAAGAVYVIRELRGAGHLETIASARDGLGSPIAVESDAAGRIFVADQAGKVIILDRSRGSVASLTCGCTPTGLFRLSGTATFRLTEPSNGPMWVLDASGADARIVAIPPAAPPVNGGGQ
jgi:sugar lactone lactonase YvrE